MTDKSDVREVATQCRWRGLTRCSIWLGEQLKSIPPDSSGNRVTVWSDGPTAPRDLGKYLLAKAAFDQREYLRAWHVTKGCQSPRPLFLHFYSRYMAGEERRQYHVSNGEQPASVKNAFVTEICKQLHELPPSVRNNDPYLLWITGVTLRCLQRHKQAIQSFIASVSIQPLFWSSWQELLVLDGGVAPALQKMQQLGHSEHWITRFVMAKQFAYQHKWERALEKLVPLCKQYPKSPAFVQHIGSARRHLHQWRSAKELFERLLELQPYRFEGIVDYSNVLFITRRHNLPELCQLARRAFSVSRYKAETCMVLADYHSAGERHSKAYDYCKRALLLDQISSRDSHILMGQEAIELKKTGLAMLSYRVAVEAARECKTAQLYNNEDTKKRCGSGWYGLGMAYELFRLPCLTLHHYIRAAQQPSVVSDQQPFWGGVAAMYEEIGMLDEASRCCNRKAGTSETILHLARLARKRGHMSPAAEFYDQYLKNVKNHPSIISDSQTTHKPDAEDTHVEALLFIALHRKQQVSQYLSENPNTVAGSFPEEIIDCIKSAKEACDTLTMCGPSVEVVSYKRAPSLSDPSVTSQIAYSNAEELAAAVNDIIKKYSITFAPSACFTPIREIQAEPIATPIGTEKLKAARKLF
eukprot:TRINITY_DN5135_c0_g1_i1.p1 TRINITY_DN5135_c0_g1~~TRINITY_DN5135_c0_g1_i1.p1  ORF type:complete len:651 (+),score=93.45 TRINITY_DN5135_c0_g1_i1:35-1954(+)